MYSMPVRTVWTFLMSPADAVGRVDVPQRGVFPAGHEDRQVLLRGRHQPAVARVDLVLRRELAAAQQPVEELVGEVLLAAAVGLEPVLEDGPLDPAHGFLLGDARVGHPVEVTLEQRLLVLRSQVAVVGMRT